MTGVVITDGGANLLRYEAGLDRFTAVAIATLAAVAISFVASRYWTFRHREHGGLGRETVLFCVANGIGVAISEGCVWLASAFGWEGKALVQHRASGRNRPRDVVPLLVLQEMGLAPEPVSCC